MLNGFSSPIFCERLKALYSLKKIDTDTSTNRGWSLIVAKEMFKMGIVEYAKTDSDGNEKTEPQQNNDLARQLKKHLEKENPPETIWIVRYCKYFNCSADYLLGFITNPTHETTDIEKTTGLSIRAIENVCDYSGEEMAILDLLLESKEFKDILKRTATTAPYYARGKLSDEISKDETFSLETRKTHFSIQKDCIINIDAFLYNVSKDFTWVIERNVIPNLEYEFIKK